MAPSRSRKPQASPREEKLHAVLDAVRDQFRRRARDFHGEHRVLSYSRRTHVQTGLENEIRIELDDSDPFQQYIVEHREFPSPRLRRSSPPTAAPPTSCAAAQASTSTAGAGAGPSASSLRRSNRFKPSSIKSEPAVDSPARSTRGAATRKGKNRIVDDISARLSTLDVEHNNDESMNDSNNDKDNSSPTSQEHENQQEQQDSDTETHVSTHP